ncbi:MAG: cation-translocating P-type ATPase [Eubacteriales bacterium]|nr:cation-translocating P-type ATPase [Eubacteriales bacterium]
MEKLESMLEWGGMKKDILLLVVSGIGLLCSFVMGDNLPFDAAWIAIILCGVPILLEAVIGLVTAFDIKADVLVAIALIASVIIGEFFAAGEVAFIMQLGGLLEELTVARARAGIEKLVKLTPRTARVISGADEKTIPAQDVSIGDILRVLPGETIPVDGIIMTGQTSIDQSVMTGEPMPVDKSTGDEVSSGTVNRFGSFDMQATRVGEDSSIQRMIRLVQSADAGKAEIVTLADKWATWVVITAVAAALLTFLVTHEILRSVTILVVFCPCAMVLATPTAIMAAIGNATKHGFLVREGDALERLSMVAKVTFDKTGTLTFGKPEVIDVICTNSSMTEEALFEMAAAAEKKSEHPLGKAVVDSFRKKYHRDAAATENFEMIPGRGVKADVNKRSVIAGSDRMLREENITVPEQPGVIAEHISQGKAVICIAVDGEFAGYLVLADTLREDVKVVLDRIRDTTVEPVLLTGDNKKAAAYVAQQLDIRKVQAECLPEDKLNYIADSQEEGLKICMVGDGINDAPALKKAYVGIAMGGIGSDIAVDAADIVLVNDEIRELPHLLELSRHMMTTIRINLIFSMGLNILAIILAITGILNPVAGALVHNSGSVIVIINSALLLGWKKR